jgi:hypothetical protein
MDTIFDAHDASAFVRAQIGERPTSDYSTSDSARVALICSIQEIWPKAIKKDTLRHAVIMALLGKPITSQLDLKWHETKVLLEVLHDADFGRSCWDELQVAVEGGYFGEPWTFPATRIV